MEILEFDHDVLIIFNMIIVQNSNDGIYCIIFDHIYFSTMSR